MYVVGIGTSAGGLDALMALFSTIHKTNRVSYVVAQHMAHDGHAALIVKLLSYTSLLEVVEAKSGDLLRADRVYFIPSGVNGCVSDGHIVLHPPSPQDVSNPSVDRLFASIAHEYGCYGVGVILSGAGSDGVRGCHAIQGQGGMTIAQHPETVAFSGMVTAAVDANVIQYVLKIDDIGNKIASLFSSRIAQQKTTLPDTPIESTQQSYIKLLDLVRKETGVDFSQYKGEMLKRRLKQRACHIGLNSLEAYLNHVVAHRAELTKAQHLFLVSVSSFFRDASAFLCLETVLSTLLRSKGRGSSIRIWVPACATGEEAYSLAIILADTLGEHFGDFHIAIMGTDINQDALKVAQQGAYRSTAFKEIDKRRLKHYFSLRGDYYYVNEEIREVCHFRKEDIINGECPDKLDLISCRNIFIYMERALQDKLIKRFYEILLPNGILFLGQSETIGLLGNTLFTPISLENQIYKRK